MERSESVCPVHDYWDFIRELKAQFDSVWTLERGFFEADELCEFAIKHHITVLGDDGKRISVVDDVLGENQRRVYIKLLNAVRNLEELLSKGGKCFTLND